MFIFLKIPPHSGNKFVSYIHEMENPHRISITIYGTTRHIQSLDVTLHHKTSIYIICHQQTSNSITRHRSPSLDVIHHR